MRGRSMMKWRVRRDSHCSSIDHEDIRRSLEVLDSVLAEFDDCLESWDTPTHLDISSPSCKKLEFTDFITNAVKSNGRLPPEGQLGYQKFPRDGSTSHVSSSSGSEQPRVSSPPPIPKRSPATKLSEQTVSVFTFPTDDTSLDSYDSARSDLSSNQAAQRQISCSLSSLVSKRKDNCDIGSDTKGPGKCTNCGRRLQRCDMEQAEVGEVPSPFHQRKQMFEDRIAEASSAIARSPSMNRSYGSSFRQKRGQPETSSELSTNLSSESGFENDYVSQNNSSEVSAVVSLTAPSTDIQNGPTWFGGCHAAKCTCKERIRQLDAKFSDIKLLLKLNKINGLDSEPPSFIPPPPPHVSDNSQTDRQLVMLPTSSSLSSSRTDLNDISSPRDNLPKTSTHNNSPMDTSLQDGEDQSFRSFSGSSNSLPTSTNDSRLLMLCNRCSSSLSVHLSETIEDLPKLLPTDALNRPHLGLSYSMEDDLPPGVKEIQQTSTPKSDVSSPRLFRTKESNLSTFSHSANSLGYISSQSDLDINDLSTLPDKIPVSSFRSRTLPNGMDRSPFYSAADEVHAAFDKVYSASEVNDYNDNRLSSARHKSVFESQLRSSSAPLPPEPEKTKTKHFRVFSRKGKKDKKKSGGTP